MRCCEIKRISYGGWPNCYRLSDGDVELIVTTDVGPRVIRYGFVDGANLFLEVPDQLGNSGESEWMMRGGHRLWVSPETVPETYALDNAPVQAIINRTSVVLRETVEPETQLQKELTVELLTDGEALVSHRITNCGSQSRRLAPWAISQMAPGGIGISRFPPCRSQDKCLQPTHPIAMWSYTDFGDPRWCFTTSYVALKQDPQATTAQKIGLFNPDTFGAYLLGSDLFTKRCTADPSATYPDFHCSFEMFTNRDFLELETLGPLIDLAPEQSVSHSERWRLYSGIELPALSEAAIESLFATLY